MVLELRKQKYVPQSECQFYNKCTAMMAPAKDVGAWKHVRHVDGVFWNVVSCIGNTIPTLDNVIGVPIKDACTCITSKVKGIKVQRSKEDQQEFERVIRYPAARRQHGAALQGDRFQAVTDLLHQQG